MSDKAQNFVSFFLEPCWKALGNKKNSLRYEIRKNGSGEAISANFISSVLTSLSFIAGTIGVFLDEGPGDIAVRSLESATQIFAVLFGILGSYKKSSNLESSLKDISFEYSQLDQESRIIVKNYYHKNTAGFFRYSTEKDPRDLQTQTLWNISPTLFFGALGLIVTIIGSALYEQEYKKISLLLRLLGPLISGVFISHNADSMDFEVEAAKKYDFNISGVRKSDFNRV